MENADQPTDSAPPTAISNPPTTATPRRTRLRGPLLVVLAGLVVLIGALAQAVWGEWNKLQAELAHARATTVVGYPGIQPRFSFADKPSDWYRLESDHILLWSGWTHGQGHSWFRVTPGDIDRETISTPLGRDIQRPIDHPLVENDGGEIWGRVPDEAVVVGDRLGGVATAYPLIVLDKVAIVNDQIEGSAFLVSFNPAAPPEEQVIVYEPIVAGRRVTMGPSGYSEQAHPVLYDRGTESLWVHRNGALLAISGSHKGSRLREVARPKRVSFLDWKSRNPSGRLVVGADRLGPRPEH